MKNLTVIPARGGSKEFQKNIKNFCKAANSMDNRTCTKAKFLNKIIVVLMISNCRNIKILCRYSIHETQKIICDQTPSIDVI